MIIENLLLYAEELLSVIGSLVIVYAALKATVMFVRGIFTDTLNVTKLRCELGYGILLGLEFMIGADIIGSMAKPTYYDIGILAMLVFIRTFLSYFLGRELAALSPEDRQSVDAH